MNDSILKKIFDYTTGVINYFALQTVCELKIADYIQAGDDTIQKLATICEVDRDSLQRILRLVVKQGFFKEESEGVYQLTEMSRYLLSEGELSMRDFLVNLDETRWNAIGNMRLAVKTGKPAFDQLYGSDYFTYLTKHPDLMAHFNRGQTNLAETEDRIIASHYDFTLYPKIVDIAGGQGGLLREILTQAPTSHGVLFDLPETIIDPAKLNHGALVGRFDLIGGSFFEAIPAHVDLYVIKRVLHDWNDEEYLQILCNVHQAMLPHSRLLIIDGILDKHNPDDLLEKIDLFLMTLTTGRERALEHFKRIADKANLKTVRVISTPTMLSMIELQL